MESKQKRAWFDALCAKGLQKVAFRVFRAFGNQNDCVCVGGGEAKLVILI